MPAVRQLSPAPQPRRGIARRNSFMRAARPFVRRRCYRYCRRIRTTEYPGDETTDDNQLNLIDFLLGHH